MITPEYYYHRCSKPVSFGFHLLDMNASELLKLIPKGTFSALALETEVDYQVKKLSGEVVFKLTKVFHAQLRETLFAGHGKFFVLSPVQVLCSKRRAAQQIQLHP